MKNFVTIISDNQSKSSALLSEHGLALKIHYNNKNILFDTGSNKTILHNLKELNINLEDFDFVFCSHGHYDHTGGFGVLPIMDKPIYIGKDFFKDCYSVQLDGSVKKISIPQEAKVKLENSPKVKTISSFTNLGNGIYSTGIIPLLEDNQSNKVFYSNEAATEINYIVDEQSMLLDNGTLITGCCHAGIKNTIIHCQHYHPEIKIKTIIGGLHLLLANSNQLQEVVQYLNSLSLEKIVLLHCTGLEAENFLKEQLDADVFIGYTGLTISI